MHQVIEGILNLKNMKILLFSALLFLTILNVKGQKKIELSIDELINKIFSDEEIHGLQSMVGFVDDMVTKRMNESDSEIAYHLILEKISESTEHYAPFKEDEKYPFLNDLDSIQFSTIWMFDTYIDMVTLRDTTYRHLENFPILNF